MLEISRKDASGYGLISTAMKISVGGFSLSFLLLFRAPTRSGQDMQLSAQGVVSQSSKLLHSMVNLGYTSFLLSAVLLWSLVFPFHLVCLSALAGHAVCSPCPQ